MTITKIRKVLGYIVFALALQYILTGCKETPKNSYVLIVDANGDITRVRKDSALAVWDFVWSAEEDNDSTFLVSLTEQTHEYMLAPATKSFERGEDYVGFYRRRSYPENPTAWEIVRFSANDAVRAITAFELLREGLGYETRMFTLEELDNSYDKDVVYFSKILTGE